MTSGAAGPPRGSGVEGPEDAAAAVVGVDVDALEPPDPAVPPVAPLAGDRRPGRRPRRRLVLGDPVAEPVGIGEGGGDPPRRGPPGRALALGLEGEPGVEVDDHVEVVGRGRRGSSRAQSRHRIKAGRSGGCGRGGWPPGGRGSRPRSARRGPRGRSWRGPRRAGRRAAPRGGRPSARASARLAAVRRPGRAREAGRGAGSRGLGRDDPEPGPRHRGPTQPRPAEVEPLEQIAVRRTGQVRRRPRRRRRMAEELKQRRSRGRSPRAATSRTGRMNMNRISRRG